MYDVQDWTDIEMDGIGADSYRRHPFDCLQAGRLSVERRTAYRPDTHCGWLRLARFAAEKGWEVLNNIKIGLTLNSQLSTLN